MTSGSAGRVWRGRLARWLPIVVFVIALVPRLWDPSPFITWDEPTWTYRSLKFARALQAGEPGATYLTAHPGVLTMWSGAGGVAARAAISSDADADLGWVDGLPEFDEDDTELLAVLTPWWPWSRAMVGLATALVIAGACALLTKLLGNRTAFYAALLLALDPYLLGHSRVLHLDALLSGLLLLSVLATLVGLRRSSAPYLALAGSLGGMAVLEKSPALFIVPFSVLLVAAYSFAERGRRGHPGGAETGSAEAGDDAKPAGHGGMASPAPGGDPPPASLPGWLSVAARALLWWSVGAAAAYIVLWPAMWSEPIGTLGAMWDYAAASAGRSREAVFFWGGVQPDPGVGLYVTSLAFRATLLGVVGLFGAIVALLRGSRPKRVVIVTLLAYAVLFTLFMGSGAKKFERYILPVIPALIVVAGIGLAWIADALARVADRRSARGGSGTTLDNGGESVGDVNSAPPSGRRRDRPALVADIVLLALIVVQGAAVLARSPYYLATYNPLLGGGPAAAAKLPVGWGEGMDLAADYLNSLDGSEDIVVATPSITLLAPLSDGRVVRAKDWPEADYVVLYVDDVQIGRPELVAELHGAREPLHVVTLSGIDYAWVYDADDLREP